MNCGVDGVVKGGVQVHVKAARTSYILLPLRHFMPWRCSEATSIASIASPVWRVAPKGVAATSHSFIAYEEPMPYMQIPMSKHPPCNQMSPAINGLTPSITMHSNQCETRV